LASADGILAADGGADLVLQAGFQPEIVIGDLDSLQATAENFADVRHLADQYTTDCDKLLALASELGHTEITLACVEGSRPDHALATLHSAARSNLEVRLVFRRGIGLILRPGRTYRLTANSRVSLLPLVPCRLKSLTGVRWPLESVVLDPLGLTSISNEGEGPVAAELLDGAAFLFAEGPPEPTWPELSSQEPSWD
jgi:thiamine pyrophosphokinase